MKFNVRVSSIFLLLVFCSCVQKMGMYGFLRPLEKSAAFALISRQAPSGTIPQVEHITTGFSPPVTRELLKKGQESYSISCVPCHGPSGYGNGMIVQRGFLPPPSFHSDRLRRVPDEHFVDVITHGFGAMYSYSDRVSEPERWAIVAYIRALQLSQNSKWNDLSVRDQQMLLGESDQ